jgi:protein kinase-like protein
MTLAAATRLGPYEIIAPLGAGGMREVYRARDTRLDRSVAIKILPAHLSSDPVRKQRFEREAKIVSGLNHPHICVVHDVGSQDGIDYLVMECVEGETLAKRLERQMGSLCNLVSEAEWEMADFNRSRRTAEVAGRRQGAVLPFFRRPSNGRAGNHRRPLQLRPARRTFSGQP